MLSDISSECWYEEELVQERLDQLSYGFNYLHAVFEIPHAEPMDRYNQGIMYYDEIMALTFMFSDYIIIDRMKVNIGMCMCLI